MKKNLQGGIGLVCLALCSTAIVLGLEAASICKAADTPAIDACSTNLSQLWWLLEKWVGDGDTFPPNLAVLADFTTNATIFKCGTNTSIENLSNSLVNLDRWTDYIYVANQRDAPPLQIPLLICPPENHDGEFGCVVWKSGGVQALPKMTIRALVAAPWCMATNATDLQLSYIKRDIVVNVPSRLRKFYPDAYRGQESSTTNSAQKNGKE